MAIHSHHRRHAGETWTSPRVASTVIGGVITSIGAIGLGAADSAALTEPSVAAFGLAQSPILSLIIVGIGMVIVLDAFDDVPGTRSLRLWGGILAALGLFIAVGPVGLWLGATRATGLAYCALGLIALAASVLLPTAADLTVEIDMPAEITPPTRDDGHW